MLHSPGLTSILKELDAKETGRSEGIIKGTPNTFEDYRESVGYIRAIREVRDYIRDKFTDRLTEGE